MSRSAMRTSRLVLGLGLGLAIALRGAPAHAQRPTQGDDESAALVGEGRTALRQGALDHAASALDQALALNPRRVEAYVLRAAVHAARKQYVAGVALLRRAEALAPADADVLTALGSQLVLSGDTAAGVPLLAQVVAKNPARYDAAQLLGHHLYATGAWAEAITVYEAYFAHRPPALASEDAQHRGDLADAYLRNGQPQQALAAFRQAAGAGAPALRARLGVAWATAAIDCGRARPLLRELEAAGAAQPEIGLVDGQCALALGDAAAAIERGRAYLARVGPGGAAGHALIGEAYAARGNLAEARRELEAAQAQEPAQRRWSVRLAAVLRRGGDPRAALAVLEPLGPPASPAGDAAWWTELGEGLLASGDPAAVIARLAPVAPALPRDAAIRTVIGAAQLAAGQGEAAVTTLEEAEAIAGTPRSKQLLAAALATVAVGTLATDPAAAEPLLVRASRLEASAVILRDLGIAQLALGRPADAIDALDRAAGLDPAPITGMLAARAHALVGQLAAARLRYERAIAGTTPEVVEVAIDWAASELASGDPMLAVAALERTLPRAIGPTARRHGLALAEARHAAGVAALRAGNPAKAVELLKASAAAAPALATRCDLALATVVVGDAPAALAALAAVAGQSCPFSSGEVLVVPILVAFTEGLTPRRAGRSLARLTALTGKATGPVAALLGTAIRVVALEAAAEAYRGGRLAQARGLLATARAARTRLGGDEVAHDAAVLDVGDGKLDLAIAQLERLAPRLPDALITLGVARERQDDPRRALDAWRRARKAGARFAPLADWIEAKEHVYGAPP
jgi:tetratricopeptide (TPR) repeat protein